MNRRQLLALYTVPGLFAEQLARTPSVEEGPFYPRQLKLDTDNDLIVLNNATTPATGEVTYLAGRILTASGAPVRDATVEIWQVDRNANYLKDALRTGAAFDPNFQGFGRFLTGSTGHYNFRTIKPIPYRGRPAPHIHFKIKVQGQPDWTTQIYIKGHPGNERDGIYRRIGAGRELVTLDFTPIPGATAGELAAPFDIVLPWR